MQLSFDCAAGPGGALLPRRLVHDAAGNAFLPWCGLLINTTSLDIQVRCSAFHESRQWLHK